LSCRGAAIRATVQNLHAAKVDRMPCDWRFHPQSSNGENFRELAYCFFGFFLTEASSAGSLRIGVGRHLCCTIERVCRFRPYPIS
jgi:hypothetical protein